jgi:hypothetical protein
MLSTNSYHLLLLVSFQDLLKETFKGIVLSTEGTISLFLLTISYNDGYLSQKDVLLIHLSSQNLICVPLLSLKDANLKKSSLTFIKPDQKCESPDFLTTFPIVWFFRCLFLKIVCHKPSSFISLNNHLLNKHCF